MMNHTANDGMEKKLLMKKAFVTSCVALRFLGQAFQALQVLQKVLQKAFILLSSNLDF